MKESFEMDAAAVAPEAKKKLKTAAEIATGETPEAESKEESGGLKSAAELAMQKTDVVAEEYNKTKPENEAIDEVRSFEELDSLIDQGKGLQGSQEFFDPATLKEVIGKVRKGELGIEYVTRTQGLREKVSQLLETDSEKESDQSVERNGSSDSAVHAYADRRFDETVVEQPEAYTVRGDASRESVIEAEAEEVPAEQEAENPGENDEENPEEGELDFETMGEARLKRVLEGAAEMQNRVQGYGKSLWEKAKDYTAKGAKAIGTALRKAFYMTFALPEMLEASDAFLGEKYAELIEAGNAKYKEIAEKITGAKDAFLERVKAAQEKRRERRETIAQAKADIAAAQDKLKKARWDLKSKFALF